MCGARQERWKSGWWNEWRSREKEQRIDVIDVIWLVFISLTHADCSVHVHIRVCMRAVACVTNGSEIFIDLVVLPRTSFTIQNLALLFAWHTFLSPSATSCLCSFHMSPFFPFLISHIFEKGLNLHHVCLPPHLLWLRKQQTMQCLLHLKLWRHTRTGFFYDLDLLFDGLTHHTERKIPLIMTKKAKLRFDAWLFAPFIHNDWFTYFTLSWTLQECDPSVVWTLT